MRVSFPDSIHNLSTRQRWHWKTVVRRYLHSVLFHLFLCLFLHFTGVGFRGALFVFLAVKFSPSWSEQNNCPLTLALSGISSWWSLQKEFGQKWQKEMEGFPQTSQWCHGHSHFPAGETKGRQRLFGSIGAENEFSGLDGISVFSFIFKFFTFDL